MSQVPRRGVPPYEWRRSRCLSGAGGGVDGVPAGLWENVVGQAELFRAARPPVYLAACRLPGCAAAPFLPTALRVIGLEQEVAGLAGRSGRLASRLLRGCYRGRRPGVLG